jgi:hypothetical protein
MLYEHRSKRPLSWRAFGLRMALHGTLAALMTALSLGLGMAGYMFYENLAWRDAFLNSAMLLGGMGPVDPPKTDGGKVFAGMYALYAGLVFLLVAGVVLVPVLHRILHHFHWEEKQKDQGSKG